MESKDARQDLQFLLAWNPIPVSTNAIKGAWFNQDRFQLSWLDSLIVSTAQTEICDYLLTEDLQENQILGAVRILNPFLHPPESLNLHL